MREPLDVRGHALRLAAGLPVPRRRLLVQARCFELGGDEPGRGTRIALQGLCRPAVQHASTSNAQLVGDHCPDQVVRQRVSGALLHQQAAPDARLDPFHSLVLAAAAYLTQQVRGCRSVEDDRRGEDLAGQRTCVGHPRGDDLPGIGEAGGGALRSGVLQDQTGHSSGAPEHVLGVTCGAARPQHGTHARHGQRPHVHRHDAGNGAHRQGKPGRARVPRPGDGRQHSSRQPAQEVAEHIGGGGIHQVGIVDHHERGTVGPDGPADEHAHLLGAQPLQGLRGGRGGPAGRQVGERRRGLSRDVGVGQDRTDEVGQDRQADHGLRGGACCAQHTSTRLAHPGGELLEQHGPPCAGLTGHGHHDSRVAGPSPQLLEVCELGVALDQRHLGGSAHIGLHSWSATGRRGCQPRPDRLGVGAGAGQRLHSELAVEHPDECPVLRERACPVPGRGEQVHEVDLGRLVEHVAGDPLPSPRQGGTQVPRVTKLAHQSAQHGADLGTDPVGGAGLPLVERGTVAQREAFEEGCAGQVRRALQARGVAGGRIGAERRHVAADEGRIQPDVGTLGAQGRADGRRDRQRAPQRGASPGRLGVGPEQRGERLSAAPLPCQAQVCQQRGGLASVEPDRFAAQSHPRRAEQVDAQRLHGWEVA